MYRIENIFFHNNTDLPVIIDYWKNHATIKGLTLQEGARIAPGEKLVLHSITGSWDIHAMHPLAKDIIIWEEKGLGKCNRIGEFCGYTSYLGDNSIIYDDLFELTYNIVDPNKYEIEGMITFTRK